jgi:membrane-associated phospholipid phosphatase
MTPRLVPWPRAALAVIAACVAVVALLGALVYDDTGGNWFDNGVLRVIRDVVPDWVQGAAMHLTDPPLVLGLLVSIAIVGLLVRRLDIAALAVLAPAVSVLLTEEVLKPLVHRSNTVVTHGLGQSEALAYPSGHETGLASLACVLGVILLSSRVRNGRKLLWAAVLALAVVAAAMGLVGQFYHYATDTIGALGVALAVTLTAGLLIDRTAAMIRSAQRELAENRN